ncbi:hypothetical protein GCM10009775_13120 [Microbacterium aoyamense]|uniref:Ribbon-helix-helix protein CopG domain-containing protein n=1 Tax=Microbacterium aoyamense TaxID=344166 RepID=A0ABN2PJE2_9MICO|nr:ribbon-helix-helix protein, CopG family [Microbacterium aoyamense]
MAMTVRLPEELDAALDALAERRHTSKHALILEATELLLSSDSKTERATSIAQSVRARYGELLTRLEDA